MDWRNFKTDPPYDAKDDEEAGLETDRIQAWFAYRFTHRPWLTDKDIFVSFRASEFYDGIFTDYKSHMKTSPYDCDWIEVLYWVEAGTVKDILQKSIRKLT